jgi:hypothetical protein
MKLEVQDHEHEGKVYFEFHLNDGPNETEKVRGYASDLITVFTKVIEWRERIQREYGEQGGLP